MAIVKNRIVKNYLLLCEGLDAVNFMIAYLNSDELKYDSRFGEEIQVMDFGGINQLRAFIKQLKRYENYTNVKRIMVLRDAETNVQSAEDSIKTALRTNDLPVPTCSNQWERSSSMPSTAYALFPTCDVPLIEGALEDLCWKILADDRADEYRRDIQKLVNQFKKRYNSIISHEHKGRLHVYFSVKDDFVSKKIGEAANAKAFNWSHIALEPLKNLLAEGFKD